MAFNTDEQGTQLGLCPLKTKKAQGSRRSAQMRIHALCLYWAVLVAVEYAVGACGCVHVVVA